MTLPPRKRRKPLAATRHEARREMDQEADASRVIAQFLNDADFRLECRVERRSRYVWLITPPGLPRKRQPVVWNRRGWSQKPPLVVWVRPAAEERQPLRSPGGKQVPWQQKDERLVAGLVGLTMRKVKAGMTLKAAVWEIAGVSAGSDRTRRSYLIDAITRVWKDLGYRSV